MRKSSSPLSRRIDRRLSAEDEGPVYTFDVDKTYLDTQWKRPLDLLKLPFEVAIDKRPFPGMAELVRACQRGGEKSGHDRPAFFLSASPAEMRFILERRMVLDGLSLDGMTLKNWAYFLPRISRLRRQTFYKLLALLTNRLELPLGCFEVLFGDDSESDALIYSMYSAILRRSLAGLALEQTLAAAGVERRETVMLMEIVDRVDLALGVDRERDWVRAIFIHRLSPDKRPRHLEMGLAPTLYASPLEPAARLFAQGLVDSAALGDIHRALRKDNAFFAADALDAIAEILDPVAPRWRTLIERDHERDLRW